VRCHPRAAVAIVWCMAPTCWNSVAASVCTAWRIDSVKAISRSWMARGANVRSPAASSVSSTDDQKTCRPAALGVSWYRSRRRRKSSPERAGSCQRVRTRHCTNRSNRASRCRTSEQAGDRLRLPAPVQRDEQESRRPPHHGTTRSDLCPARPTGHRRSPGTAPRTSRSGRPGRVPALEAKPTKDQRVPPFPASRRDRSRAQGTNAECEPRATATRHPFR